MNEKEIAILNRIREDRTASKPERPLPSAPFEGEGGKVGEPSQLNEETFRQIVELARRDAKQEFNVETAKLEFAGGAAWAIACFGIAMIAMVAVLGYKRILQPSKLIALGLIVTSALLLIVLGYTDEQMSPVIGLLGTIAGYMLGSKEWDGNDTATTAAADAEKLAEAEKKKKEANETAATKEGPSVPDQKPAETEDPIS